MNQPTLIRDQEEWVRILGKGMVTIPKTWRDELGLKPGQIIKARKAGNTVILEREKQSLPYRVYTDEEIDAFLKEDQLPQSLAQRIQRKIQSLKK